VDVVPLFSMDKMRMVSGVYGPFRPPAKSRIPLWMALNLKQKKKCRIIPPPWLSVEYLQNRLKEELSEQGFSQLPYQFAEISKVLLDVASDDLQSPDKIRTLLKDLREARQAKSREGLRKLDHIALSLPNLCSMEINEIRPFFSKAMNVMIQLTPEQSTSQEQSSTALDDFNFDDELQ